jgi:hypothetical protein
METATKKNLFASAKKAEPTTASKSKTPALEVPVHLLPLIAQYKEAKDNLKNWEGKKEMAEGQLKTEASQIFMDECAKAKRNIGSFKLDGLTISVQDKYTKMTPDLKAIVQSHFPEVVETTTTYSFNQEILNKHIEKISEALSAAGLPDEDLENLIVANEETKVKKGTIDLLPQYGDNMSTLFMAISPVVSIR